MNILIIGANGRVGSALVNLLAQQGHTVYAAARKTNTEFSHNRIRQIHFNLLAELPEMVKAVENLSVDMIYFTAGSRGKNLLQADAFGAVKTMQMAKQLGIKRYVMLSSVFALQPERWNEKFLADITDYNIAKFFADNYLVNQSGLDYTVLQPGALSETEASGTIQTDVNEPLPNSLGNVVMTLAALTGAENTIRRVITMADGQTPIKQALTEIK